MESYNYENLPEEIIREIMNEEDPETIISNCRANKKLFEVCKDPYFWLKYAKGLNHPDFQKLLIILADYKIFKPLNELLPTEDKNEKRKLPIVDFHTAKYLFMVVVENGAESLVPRLRPYFYQDDYFNTYDAEEGVNNLKKYVRAINRVQDPEEASYIGKPRYNSLSVEYQSKYIMDNVEEDIIRALFIFSPIEQYGLSDNITDGLLTYWSKTGDQHNLLFFINEIYPRIPEHNRTNPAYRIKAYSPPSILKMICKEKIFSDKNEFMCDEKYIDFGAENIDTTLYQIETSKEGIYFPGNDFLKSSEDIRQRLSHTHFGIYPDTYIRLVKRYIPKVQQLYLFKVMRSSFTLEGYTMAALLCQEEIEKF